MRKLCWGGTHWLLLVLLAFGVLAACGEPPVLTGESEYDDERDNDDHEGSTNLLPYQAVGPEVFVASTGRLLAAQCAQCHGSDGRSRNDIDSLAYEGSGEVLEEMLEMQNSAYTNDIMHQQARGYTLTEIRQIAAWFDTQQSR